MRRTALVVLLVALLVLLALPLGVMAAMGPCPECPALAQAGLALCLVVLVSVALALPNLTFRADPSTASRRLLLLSLRPYRPPRSA